MITHLEAQDYFDNNDSVIITVGCIEGHGAHNVLGVDNFAPQKILELIGAKSDILIAPPIPYGFCDLMSGFPGTVSIDDEVLYRFIKCIANELYSFGIRRFIFLNGHGGNTGALDHVCMDLYRKGALGAIFNWWLLSPHLNPKWKVGHGGGGETAAMLAIDPNLVRTDKIEDCVMVNDIEGFISTNFHSVMFKDVEVSVPRDVPGYCAGSWIDPIHPKHATAEWGREMLQANADYMCDFIEQFKRAPLPRGV
jgi:creatinine amidohydrolase